MAEILEDRDGMMKIRVSKELLQLLKRLKWFDTFAWWASRMKPGDTLGLRDGAPLAPYVGFYAGGDMPKFGAFSYSFSPFDRTVSIGAYCSISAHVRVMGTDRPLNRVATTGGLYQRHKVFANAYDDAQRNMSYRLNPQKKMPTIGNDVWIGQDVLLGKGITIGDGAVIAAGSVVTRDVLPYQIVGGAPANVIRYRFTETERALLQRSRWWAYAMPDLMSGPTNDISAFVGWLADGVSHKTIRQVKAFSESLTDIIRSGQVSTFFTSGDSLLTEPIFVPDPVKTLPVTTSASNGLGGIRSFFERLGLRSKLSV